MASDLRTDEQIQHSLHYATEMGWRVFPCHSVREGNCSCGREPCANAGKHPRVKDMLNVATTDPEQIREWWEKWPDANIGIATGDGLVVIDVDRRHGGMEKLAELEAELGELPRQFCVKSGGGGLHIYLSLPTGVCLRGNAPWTPAIDALADGKSVVAPPSNHVSGSLYAWTSLPVGSIPPLVPHKWQAQLLTSELSNSRSGRTDNTDTTDTTETTDTTDITYLSSVVSVSLPSLPEDVARYVRNVVKRCVVTGPGQTNDKLVLKLAVKLKGIPELLTRDAEEFEPLIRWWFQQSRDHMSEKDWRAVWGRWLYTWTWAKPGFNQPWEACKLAMSGLPPEAEEYPCKALRLLIATCRVMSERFADDDGVWYLSSREAGDLIEVHEAVANRWLRMLVNDGVLEYAAKHRRGTRQAQRYRYLGKLHGTNSESKSPPDTDAA